MKGKKKKVVLPKNLKKGDKHPFVAIIQLMLLAGEYNDDIIIDGEFGDQTAKGLMAYQEEVGLEQTGVLDKRTVDNIANLEGVYLRKLDLAVFDPASYS